MDMSLDRPAVNKEPIVAVLKMLCLIIDLKYSLAFDLSWINDIIINKLINVI
jgi:hypothetical protein